MIIEEQFEVDVPIDRMFQELNDVGQIGNCIAGVKSINVISADESQWEIEAKAGFMSRTFNLNGKITERRAPEYLAFSGTGQDLKVAGHVELRSLTANRTECKAVIEATVVGPFASIVDLMAKGPQQALIRKTIENIHKRLESVAPNQEPSAPVAIPPSAPRASLPATPPRATSRRLSRRALHAELATLRRAVDRQEIYEALMRYCRGVDRWDEAMINSAFHADATLDGGGIGLAPEWAKMVAGTGGNQRMHFVGNVSIDLDGDSAFVESYWLAFQPSESEGKTYTRTRAARWLDRFERRNGEWKIARRMIVDEWGRLDELEQAPEVRGRSGEKGGNDPYYHMRELLGG